MPAQVFIPQRFPTERPEALRTELERFARSMDSYTRGATETFAPRLTAFPTVNTTKLILGQVVRVSLADGESLRLQLPPPARENFGKKCTLLRTATTGLIQVFGGEALVGGVAIYQMANDIHFVEFLLDDGAYYPSRAGAGIAL
jgi:hypothetical protein